MAVDTRQKRFSMMTLNQVYKSAIPVPSGAFDQADRQQLLFGYSGILWGAIASLPEILIAFGARSKTLIDQASRAKTLTSGNFRAKTFVAGGKRR